MSYCRSCGYTLGDMRFCGRCGADGWAAPAAPAAPYTGPPAQAVVQAPPPPASAPAAGWSNEQWSLPAPPAPSSVGFAPPPPGWGPPRTVHSLNGLATALLWLYVVAAVAVGFWGLALLNQSSALTEFEDRRSSSTAAQDYLDASNVSAAMGLLYFLAVLAAGVVTIVWLWRATANLDKFPNPPRRLGPGWAIGAWFIPIVSWIMPKQLLNDAWRGAAPEGTGGRPWNKVPVPPVMGIWWAGWVIGSLLLYGGGQVSDSDEFGTVETGLLMGALGTACLIGAAVFAIISIRQISRRHHEAAQASRIPVT